MRAKVEMTSVPGQSEEVKSTVLSVLDFHIQKIITSRGMDSTEYLYLCERSHEDLQHRMANGLKKYMKITAEDRGSETVLTAKIHLPYIANKRIKNLERDEIALMSSLSQWKAAYYRQLARVEELKRPWYKKLMSKMKL